MAILKDVLYPQGYTATYHRIRELEMVRIDDGKARVVVATYLNKTVRDNGAGNFIELKVYEIPLAKAALLDGTALEVAYEALMELPEFEGAEEG